MPSRPVSNFDDQPGGGIVLNMAAERPLLQWTPDDSPLCAVRLDGPVGVSSGRLKRRCLFIVLVYVPNDYSSNANGV